MQLHEWRMAGNHSLLATFFRLFILSLSRIEENASFSFIIA
jgi:hypothetical protein